MDKPSLNHWTIRGPGGELVWDQRVRPPHDIHYPAGSAISAPGQAGFTPLAGGTGWDVAKRPG